MGFSVGPTQHGIVFSSQSGGNSFSSFPIRFPDASEFSDSGAGDGFQLFIPSGESDVWWASLAGTSEPSFSGSPTYHAVPFDGDELADEVCAIFSQAIVNTHRWTISGYTPQTIPVNSVAPTLDKTTVSPGDTISVSSGTWTQDPTDFLYKWFRDDVEISGETASTYNVEEGEDLGTVFTASVAAQNGIGTSSYVLTSNSATVVAAFSPADIPDLEAYWDARLGADKSTGVPAGNGEAVQFWIGQAGTSFDATQSTSLLRPTVQDAWNNSNPALNFDGSTGQNMTTSADGALKPFTAVAVVSYNSGGNNTILGPVGFTAGITLRINSSGQLELLKSGTLIIATDSTSMSVNSRNIVAVSYSGTGQYQFWINGSKTGSGTNNQSFDASSLMIGADKGFDAIFGQIAAVALYASVVSDSNMDKLSDYLNDIWGVF